MKWKQRNEINNQRNEINKQRNEMNNQRNEIEFQNFPHPYPHKTNSPLSARSV